MLHSCVVIILRWVILLKILIKTSAYKGIGGRIYATAQNPFIITKYEGLDPEVKSGIDSNPYPRAFTFLLGVNLQF